MPRTSALPPSGARIVVRMRTAVVLPAPLGPSRPSTVPVGTRRSMPSSAVTVPKHLRRPSVTTAASRFVEVGISAIQPVCQCPPNRPERFAATFRSVRFFTPAEHAIIAAVADRLIPPIDEHPGGAALGVADYIDGLLGAFADDPPRIWAGGPFSGRAGGGAS